MIREISREIRILDKLITAHLEELGEVKGKLYGTARPVEYRPEKKILKSGGGTTNIGQYYMELIDQVDGEVDRLYGLKTRLKAEIDAVEDPTLRLLLELRYVQGLRWDDVAEKMQYSLDHVKGYLNSQALQELNTD